ncbi:MAG: hypothetical protein WHS38_00310 [Thermodesulforhabdaceae bacterium]
MAVVSEFAITIFLVVLVGACAFQPGGVEAENQEAYMTIQEVHSLCEKLGKCGNILCCEGKTVKLKGYLDPVNIWYREKHPWLDYEKFIITGKPDPYHDPSDSIEIYVSGNNTIPFFRKLQKISSRKLIYVEGTIEGVNAYTNKGPLRLLRIRAHPEHIMLPDQ